MSIETINLNTPSPSATSIFSMPLYQGASFNSQYGTWWINYVGGFMRFNLNLSGQDMSNIGVVINCILCSTTVNGVSNCPLTISVNGTNVVVNWDNHNNNFYSISWAVPLNLLNSGSGGNTIQFTLTGGNTAVMIKQVSALVFQMQHQQQTNWCWAGVSTSVSKYYNRASGWTQCTVVNSALGQTTCCQSGGSSQCNQPWYLDRALQITGNYTSMQAGSIPAAQLQGQSNGMHPTGIRIGWSGGGGHFIVGSGVSQNNSMVMVEDPWYGSSYITYSTLQNAYQGTGSWTHTYFTHG